jgi:uncharacterized protein (TIGR02449 family)
MTDPEISQLESRVDALLTAYHRLQVSNRTLNAEWQGLVRKNTDLRRRLEAVIARIRTLEQQAEEEPQV